MEAIRQIAHWFSRSSAKNWAIVIIAMTGGGLASCAWIEKSTTPTDLETAPVAKVSQDLYLCYDRVSNAPDHDANRKIIGYRPYLRVNDRISLITAPAEGACLTSGFGIRSGRAHKGLDFQSNPAGLIFAAGQGEIIEDEFHRDYGNMIVISHGDGVYTRYAHLASVHDCIDEGKTVAAGSVLGVMGKSGRTVAVHLHYEILTGDLQKAGSPFNLKPVNPFSLPGADGLILAASGGPGAADCS